MLSAQKLKMTTGWITTAHTGRNTGMIIGLTSIGQNTAARINIGWIRSTETTTGQIFTDQNTETITGLILSTGEKTTELTIGESTMTLTESGTPMVPGGDTIT